MCCFPSQEAVSSSSSEELFSSGERQSLCSRKRRCLVAGSRKRSVSITASPERSIFDLSPTVRTLPQESYLSSASSTSSSVVELDVQVVDSPVASPSPANSPSPEADRTSSWESLTMSAASSASPLPAALQSDFLFSLTDAERRHLCGGHEENLAGEEGHVWSSNHSLIVFILLGLGFNSSGRRTSNNNSLVALFCSSDRNPWQ